MPSALGLQKADAVGLFWWTIYCWTRVSWGFSNLGFPLSLFIKDSQQIFIEAVTEAPGLDEAREDKRGHFRGKNKCTGWMWGRDRGNWVLWGALLHKPLCSTIKYWTSLYPEEPQGLWSWVFCSFPIYKMFSYIAAECWVFPIQLRSPSCHTCAITLCFTPKCWGWVGTLPLSEASHKFLALRK